jgi:hypothetical protein
MNRIHHTIFNRCRGLVQVVSENARRRRKAGWNKGSVASEAAGSAARGAGIAGGGG